MWSWLSDRILSGGIFFGRPPAPPFFLFVFFVSVFSISLFCSKGEGEGGVASIFGNTRFRVLVVSGFSLMGSQ